MSDGPILLRRRPLTIEAWQVDEWNVGDVATWAGGVVIQGRGVGVYTDAGDFVKAAFGDWIIRGPFGEFYPATDRAVFAAHEAIMPMVAE